MEQISCGKRHSVVVKLLVKAFHLFYFGGKTPLSLHRVMFFPIECSSSHLHFSKLCRCRHFFVCFLWGVKAAQEFAKLVHSSLISEIKGYSTKLFLSRKEQWTLMINRLQIGIFNVYLLTYLLTTRCTINRKVDLNCFFIITDRKGR